MGQEFESLKTHHYGGRSSVGRAPDCDSGCRGFESHRSPHFTDSANVGVSPSGKAPDFDSGIRWFESSYSSQFFLKIVLIFFRACIIMTLP